MKGRKNLKQPSAMAQRLIQDTDGLKLWVDEPKHKFHLHPGVFDYDIVCGYWKKSRGNKIIVVLGVKDRTFPDPDYISLRILDTVKNECYWAGSFASRKIESEMLNAPEGSIVRYRNKPLYKLTLQEISGLVAGKIYKNAGVFLHDESISSWERDSGISLSPGI